MHCLPIFLDTELNSLFYNGYCKSILSPVLHGCTMVYDDAEDSFSWQKNTATALTYQNAYRRVNNVFAQEILKYCQQLRVLEDECVSGRSVRNSPIIWINGYQLMLLPRDLRLYMENMNRKCARSMVLMTSHSITPAPTAVPNLYAALPRSPQRVGIAVAVLAVGGVAVVAGRGGRPQLAVLAGPDVRGQHRGRHGRRAHARECWARA